VQGNFDQLNEGQRVNFEEEPSAKGTSRRQRPRRGIARVYPPEAAVLTLPAVKVVLFDIDVRLVLTGGAGARAMNRAFADVFDLHRDYLVSRWRAALTRILSEMARQHGLEYDEPMLQRFHTTYLDYLSFEIQQPGTSRKAILPGVRELLDALIARDDVPGAADWQFSGGARLTRALRSLALLSVRRVRRRCPERNALLAKALARVAASGGPTLAPADAIVVGDTPHDVNVALAGGAKSLAVATGSFDVQALRETGADVVLEDLSDLPSVLSVLGVNESRE
jgi:phosphoglycolate phosphatase-like HAD superfamily hydrolase